MHGMYYRIHKGGLRKLKKERNHLLLQDWDVYMYPKALHVLAERHMVTKTHIAQQISFGESFLLSAVIGQWILNQSDSKKYQKRSQKHQYRCSGQWVNHLFFGEKKWAAARVFHAPSLSKSIVMLHHTYVGIDAKV